MEENEIASPSTSADTETLPQSFVCDNCSRSFHEKEIMRIMMSEHSFHITILIICMIIRNGAVTNKSKDTINFLKLTHDEPSKYPIPEIHDGQEVYPKLFDALDCANTNSRLHLCAKHHPKHDPRTWQRSVEPSSEIDDDITISFIRRLAYNLHLSIPLVNQCVDSILTAHSEIIIDFDLVKLERMSHKSEQRIRDIIMNMFWQPRGKQGLRVEENLSSWFQWVDRGFVLPLSPLPRYHLRSYSKIDETYLLKCSHVLENSSLNLISWYFEQHFYKDVYTMHDPYLLFLNRLRIKKIQNSMVYVVKDNPLVFYCNFAYFVSSNFYASQKYVRDYIVDTGVFDNPIIYLRNDAPFIIRSRKPKCEKHIFHIVYKDRTYDRPTYENLFKALTLLRDIMLRMNLYHITMPKIDDGLDFNKVLQMIHYVFLDSHINVIIGLNSKWYSCTGNYLCNDKSVPPFLK